MQTQTPSPRTRRVQGRDRGAGDMGTGTVGPSGRGGLGLSTKTGGGGGGSGRLWQTRPESRDNNALCARMTALNVHQPQQPLRQQPRTAREPGQPRFQRHQPAVVQSTGTAEGIRSARDWLDMRASDSDSQQPAGADDVRSVGLPRASVDLRPPPLAIPSTPEPPQQQQHQQQPVLARNHRLEKMASMPSPPKADADLPAASVRSGSFPRSSGFAAFASGFVMV